VTWSLNNSGMPPHGRKKMRAKDALWSLQQV
jgi:hypothetical protein